MLVIFQRWCQYVIEYIYRVSCMSERIFKSIPACRLESEWQHNADWVQTEVVHLQPRSNYLSFSVVAVESRSLDLWSLPIATLWLCHWEEILIFSRLQIESVSLNHVPATSLIPSFSFHPLALPLSPAVRYFITLSLIHSKNHLSVLSPVSPDSSLTGGSGCDDNTVPQKLLILDARSYTAAVANRAKGGGCECEGWCDQTFEKS